MKDLVLARQGIEARIGALLALSFVASCAQRATPLLLPISEPGIDGGPGIVIKLDANPNQGEAGAQAGYDGAMGCTGTKELCNGIDDDCDGVIDNGFSLQTDPGNCGGCGVICSAAGAVSMCVKGQCAIASCNPGYADADKNPVNGCECLLTNGGVEICDGADNDCDGVVDDGFDLQNDPANCGVCGFSCKAANATSFCKNGTCGFTCASGYFDIDKQAGDGCEYACTRSASPTEICDGFDNDCNGLVDDADPGIVYNPADRICYSSAAGSCQSGTMTCLGGKEVCIGAGPPSDEICDGRDNNCNGQVDESDPNLGKSCYMPGAAGCDTTTGACVGACKMGAYACTGGKLACAGMVIPTVELCDGLDNDCDGTIDNGIDPDSDLNNCGGCGHACKFDNAVAVCVHGVCVLDPKTRQGSCVAGWVDANANPADGCEYQCTPDGPEICDGKDNDCNGLIDTADPGLLYPSNFCVQIGECGKGPGGSTHKGWEGSATYPVCTVPSGAPVSTAPRWLCNYPATVQVQGADQILTKETWCDGLDNDCNGVVDDPWAKTLGTSCSDPSSTAVGACLRKGVLRCQTDKTLPASCDFTGMPPAASPTDELCDGIDNDCDGLVDEPWDNPAGLGQCGGHDCLGVRDQVVHVNASGAPGGGYYIYTYEASRVDATASSQGTLGTRACSRAQVASGGAVLPWSSSTWNQADAACRAAGMRLCRTIRTGGAVVSDEWGFACMAGQTACTVGVYPYGCSYSSAACNGADSGTGKATACGSLASCTTVGDLDTASASDQVVDLSGNLAEWTDDRRDIANTGGSPDGAGSATAIYTTRGGAYDSFYPGMACDFMGTQLHPTFSHPDTGFRCCSSCSPGQAECGGACKNLATDAANCGGCAVACAAGKTCQNGSCK
jgi:hypothetical protein